MQNQVDAPSTHLPLDTSLPQPSSVRQIDGLQLLRAVAVILVVWCHAGQMLDTSGSHGFPGLGIFGIDIFFVISGFILSLTVLRERAEPGASTMWEFMKRRFIRIYPIYWFVALLTLARLTLSHQIFKHNYLPAFFLLPPLQYPDQYFIVGYSWTMSFEMFFYVLLGLILLKTVKRAIPALMFLLIAAVAIGSVVGIKHPVAILVGNPILLEFVLGAAIALLYVRVAKRRVAGITLAVIGAAASVYLSMQFLPSVAVGPQMILVDKGVFPRVATWGICAALIVGGIVFWSPSMKSNFAKVWVMLGNCSYSAYVISALVMEYTTRVFLKLDKPPILSLSGRLLFELTLLTAVMTFGMLCYTFVERPMLRFLQHRFLHKVRSLPARASKHQPANV
ncbi:MAG: acyltransferase [Acidobacteria bacterium]|nr:acyltransferase [Acidobacteriota bacterium]